MLLVSFREPQNAPLKSSRDNPHKRAVDLGADGDQLTTPSHDALRRKYQVRANAMRTEQGDRRRLKTADDLALLFIS